MKIIITAIVASLSSNLFAQNKDSIEFHTIENVILYNNKKEIKQTSVSRHNLDVIQSTTLGETLSRISGIQNVAYGADSGSPMIRSLSANRVKIMNNGLSINALSNISPDYNIEFNQDTASEIGIYKGAATVLFGGKAIGGAVNIHTDLFSRNKENFAGAVTLEGSINNGNKQSVNLSGNISKSFVWQVRASNYQRNFIRIPNHSKSDYCYDPNRVGFDPVFQSLCQVNVKSEHILNTSIFPYLNQFVLDHLHDSKYELADSDKYTFEPKYFDKETFVYRDNPKNPDFVAGQDPEKDRYKSIVSSINDVVPLQKGRIPNSHSKRKNTYFSIGYIGNAFLTGIAYEGNYAYYGIPGYAIYEKPTHSHHDEHTSEIPQYKPINIEIQSHRVMSESILKINGIGIKDFQLKYSGQFSKNYEYLETLTANVFSVNQHNLRAEIQQIPWKFLTGISGIDIDWQRIEGDGNLRYMPNSISKELGFFTLQKFHFGKLSANLGYRHDLIKREAIHSDGYIKSRGRAGGNLSARDFKLNQLSAKLSFEINKNILLSSQYNYAERAPEVNELYTGNNHFAILAAENGDDQLDKEHTQTFEVSGIFRIGNFKINTSFYQSKFKNYIYLGHTGISRNGFSVKEWRTGDTMIRGIETELSYISKFRNGSFEIGGFYDFVQNQVTDDNSFRKHLEGIYMPNMPTSRFSINTSFNYNKLSVNLMFEHYFKQKYLGKNINFEPAMPAYNMLGARISYKIPIKNKISEIYILGSNLLNVEARPQNSLLKYISPLAGINIGLGIKINI